LWPGGSRFLHVTGHAGLCRFSVEYAAASANWIRLLRCPAENKHNDRERWKAQGTTSPNSLRLSPQPTSRRLLLSGLTWSILAGGSIADPPRGVERSGRSLRGTVIHWRRYIGCGGQALHIKIQDCRDLHRTGHGSRTIWAIFNPPRRRSG